MYYLKVKSHFDSAHFLRNYEGKCANIHGHTWKIEIVVKGSQLNEQGLLIDFGVLKKMLAEVVADFDHKLINDLEEFGPGKLNPTAENIAYYIYKRLNPILPNETVLDSVEIWESEKASAIYKEC